MIAFGVAGVAYRHTLGDSGAQQVLGEGMFREPGVSEVFRAVTPDAGGAPPAGPPATPARVVDAPAPSRQTGRLAASAQVDSRPSRGQLAVWAIEVAAEDSSGLTERSRPAATSTAASPMTQIAVAFSVRLRPQDRPAVRGTQ